MEKIFVFITDSLEKLHSALQLGTDSTKKMCRVVRFGRTTALLCHVGAVRFQGIGAFSREFLPRILFALTMPMPLFPWHMVTFMLSLYPCQYFVSNQWEITLFSVNSYDSHLLKLDYKPIQELIAYHYFYLKGVSFLSVDEFTAFGKISFYLFIFVALCRLMLGYLLILLLIFLVFILYVIIVLTWIFS